MLARRHFLKNIAASVGAITVAGFFPTLFSKRKLQYSYIGELPGQELVGRELANYEAFVQNTHDILWPIVNEYKKRGQLSEPKLDETSKVLHISMYFADKNSQESFFEEFNSVYKKKTGKDFDIQDGGGRATLQMKWVRA